jgi:hypothetical protein
MITLPAAVAGLIAFFVAIAPVTSAISTLSTAISTTETVVTNVKADIARHKQKKPKPAAKKCGANQ